MTDKNLKINYRQINEEVIHKAGYIIIDPWTIIKDAYINVKSGIIKEIGKNCGNKSVKTIDHGKGVILPALINAHTHLELSFLKNKLCFNNGFINWVKQLIDLRANAKKTDILNSAANSTDDLKKSGSFYIGEISSLGYTDQLFKNSKINGVWFKEYLGNDLDKENISYKDKNIFSIAGHAPHTTSPELLKKLKAIANKYPFSIHTAESQEEVEFLADGKGKWKDFLDERGLDISAWKINKKTPVPYLKKLGILDKYTILVHLIYIEKKDLDIISDTGSKICLCLRSNKNLHSKLPDIYNMINKGLKPCLGTDSLASVDSLSIFDEMNFISDNFPLIDKSEILAMATINGAEALGLSEITGTLEPKKKACFLYLEIDSDFINEPVSAVINRKFSTGKIIIYV